MANPNFTKSHHFTLLDPPKGVKNGLKHIYTLYFSLRRRLRRRKIFLAGWWISSFLYVNVRGRDFFFFVMERPAGQDVF